MPAIAGSARERALQRALERQRALIDALCDPAAWPHPVASVRHIETHISHVLLAGETAYKIKKPVDLGFLDFSTLEARRHFCEEELRLNRRLAPGLYLDVVAITGSAHAPRVGAAGAAIEYAVRMRAFAQDALLDAMCAAGTLAPAHIDEIAARVAAFHADAPRAGAASPYGLPEAIRRPMLENFAQIGVLPAGEGERERLGRLESWSLAGHARLAPLMRRRHDEGFVRECHGDLHLGNIALFDGRVQIFDCIEFNAELRWIDIASEIAFLFMDLTARARTDYAARFLDRVLEIGGDHAGLALLRHYAVYRAMVRAKVAAIRAAQPGLDAAGREAALADFSGHLRLAGRLTRPAPGALILTHGYSGSGKSTYAQALLEGLGAVRVRSDVERKRMLGLTAHEDTGSAVGRGAYARQATQETYARLARLADEALDAGFPVIVDAAFLKREQRDAMRALAERRAVPFFIVSVSASESTLRRRVAERRARGGDASEATAQVLDWQLRGAEPLASDELGCVIPVDSERDAPQAAIGLVRARLAAARHDG